MLFLEQLNKRFPTSNFDVLNENSSFSIIRFDIEFRGKKYWVVSTNGLWKYTMPVSPKYAGKEHVELCVCVEEDWDFSDKEHLWPAEKLAWLGNYMLEKQSWFGEGHTIPNGKPPQAISVTITQDHFYFDEATFMHESFKPFYVEDTLVNFLFLIPITKDELDYKNKKSTFNFKRKIADKGIHEVVEEFRPSLIDRKWRFW
jgi:hypothetical protein